MDVIPSLLGLETFALFVGVFEGGVGGVGVAGIQEVWIFCHQMWLRGAGRDDPSRIFADIVSDLLTDLRMGGWLGAGIQEVWIFRHPKWLRGAGRDDPSRIFADIVSDLLTDLRLRG